MRRLMIVMLVAILAILSGMPMAGAAEEAAQPAAQAQGAEIQNDYLSVVFHPVGVFASGATGLVTGRRYPISDGWPDANSVWGTRAYVKIDDWIHMYGWSGGTTQPPTNLSDTVNEMVWMVDGIEVVQHVEIVTSQSSGLPDTGMYKYVITNKSSKGHSVGLRLLIDMNHGYGFDGPIFVSGVGPVPDEREWAGDDMPQYYQVLTSWDDSTPLEQGTLVGGDATPPDRFILADALQVQYSFWDYTPVQRGQFWDSGASLYWNPVSLAPGETREIVTYYGLGLVEDTDVTAPVTTATVAPEPNAAGWNQTEATVTLTAADESDGSGVKRTAYTVNGGDTQFGTEIPLATDGIYVVRYWSEDQAGNVEAAKSMTVKVDRTAPTITYAGNKGTYHVIETVAIDCSASDGLSGIAGASCDSITGSAYTFPLGTNTATAWAEDGAGNRADATASFRVEVTLADLCALTEQWATKEGVAKSLCAKLDNAARAKAAARLGMLGAYINEVEAQTGKAISEPYAEILIRFARSFY